MEYQDNLGYINLSRKELQELCKNNNLPANRSTTQLAKSLTSYFKNKVVSSAPLKVRSSGAMEDDSYDSCLPNKETKDGTPFHEGEAVRGAYEKSVNSSESDTYKMVSFIEENGISDKNHCRTRDQLHNNDFMDLQTLDTTCDNGATAIHACKFNNESTYILDWSLPEQDGMCVKSSAAGDVQHALIGPQLGHWCYHDSIKNESQNSQNPRNYDQKLLVTTKRDNEAHLLSSRCPKLFESSIEVGYASSYESYIKAAPTFDFFVMSDDGINLYVDLNSSTSGWIQKLKDEVCINQKVHQNSGSLANHTRDILDVDVQMKYLQSKSISLKPQKEADRGTRFTNSSFGPVFRGTSQEAHPFDASLASSGSSILTSSSSPVDMCNQVVSSSCIAYSNFQNLMTIENTSTLQEENTLHQDSLDNPFRAKHGNTGNVDAEVNVEHNSASTNYGKDNIQKSEDCLNHVKDSDDDTTETQMFLGHTSSLEGESMCGVLFVPFHEKSSGSCQLAGQSNFYSAAHLFQNHSNSLRDSVPKSSLSFGENLRKDVAVLEKDGSDCSEFQNSMDKNSKRSCNPEIDEVILNNKRHRSDQNYCNNKKGYLGSTISSTKEIVSDATIPPRRSSRFLSK